MHAIAHPALLAADARVLPRPLPQQVALGCARLEEAASLLHDAGQPQVSPILEQEIAEALAELKPACTLEHLQVSAPLFQQQRKCSLQLCNRARAAFSSDRAVAALLGLLLCRCRHAFCAYAETSKSHSLKQCTNMQQDNPV